MVADSTKSLREMLKKHFGFLESDYGFEIRRTPADRRDRQWLPSIAYATETVGVFVQYDARDQYLGVTIHQLDDGQFPMRGERVATSQGWSLNGVIHIDDPQGLLGTWPELNARGGGRTFTFDDYVERGAAQLRRHGDDLLRGDFSRSFQIQQAEQEIRAKRDRGQSSV
jgi:hypothetical protein